MKKIVIIGASSGLGRRMALDFARVGCRVGLAARREEPLREIKSLYPASVAYRTIDITDPDAPARFCNLIEDIDGMDILVMAAGVYNDSADIDNTLTSSSLAVNVTGWARIVNEAMRYFRDTANGPVPGRMAAITSVAGVRGLAMAPAYSAAKAFQQRYLEALRQLAHLHHINVRITDIRPGFIRTPLLDPDKSYPMSMSVDYAAPLIEKAVLKGRRVEYIDSRWGLVARLERLIPPCLWDHLVLTVS